MNKERRSAAGLGALLAVVICAGILPAEDIPPKTPKATIRVESWLVAGPLASPLPGFGGAGDKPFGAGDLLKFEPAELSGLHPQDGGELLWTDGKKSAWRTLAAGDKGAAIAPSGAAFETAYFAAFIDVARYVPARISFVSIQPFQAYLDGRPIASKLKASKAEGAADCRCAGRGRTRDRRPQARNGRALSGHQIII